MLEIQDVSAKVFSIFALIKRGDGISSQACAKTEMLLVAKVRSMFLPACLLYYAMLYCES